MDFRLIVGLGNIGEKYRFTRHNIGFIFIDKISDFYSSSFKMSVNSLTAEFVVGETKVILVKPTTYMNNSGVAVKYWKDWFGICDSSVFVLADDLHLDVGDIRFRVSGGSGGHNGLKSIENNIGNCYCRLRIGIGNNYKYGEQGDFVLSDFGKEELNKVLSNVECVLSLVDIFVKISDVDDRIKKINNLLSIRE